METPVYLDNNATTPMDPRVLEAMLPYFCTRYGNAASRSHSLGWEAGKAVDLARQQVAGLIGAADPAEIIWTSGATESNNLAIKGVAAMYGDKGHHVITQATEHKAVLDPVKRLESQGAPVTVLPVDSAGGVALSAIEAAIRPDTVLVSIMLANNETGVIQDVAAIGKLCRARGILFHTDATQAAGKLPIDVQAMQIDLLSLSGHKLYGPKGCGCLFVRKSSPRIRLTPLLDGGGHERGFRSGTLNVPGIVGVGVACELARRDGEEESRRLALLRDRLEEGLGRRLAHVTVNGGKGRRLPGTSNVSFAFVEGESLMLAMREVAVSSGSACTSASLEPSYVLRAMGVPDELAHCSIRFSLGRFNTREEIDFVIDKVVQSVQKLRAMSPLAEDAQASTPSA